MKNIPYFRVFSRPAVRIRYSGPLLLAVLIGVVSAAGGEHLEELVQKKGSLSRVLDSLQIEKQLRKREGRPIGPLDSRTAVLRDTIEAVRRRLTSIDAIRNQGKPERNSFSLSSFSSWRPRTAFDWVIVVVAATAACSGLVLLLGILSSLRQATRRRSKMSAQSDPTPTSGEPYKSKSVSFKEEKWDAAPCDGFEEVDSIRLRIARDTGHFAAVSERPSSIPAGGSTPKTTRACIVTCLRQGKSVHQTARELQVSIDQVNLVSRIADSDPT